MDKFEIQAPSLLDRLESMEEKLMGLLPREITVEFPRELFTKGSGRDFLNHGLLGISTRIYELKGHGTVIIDNFENSACYIAQVYLSGFREEDPLYKGLKAGLEMYVVKDNFSLAAKKK
jgi:hypothetical protein